MTAWRDRFGNAGADATPDPAALRSERHLRFFEAAFTRLFRRHMRALRVPRWGLPQVPAGAPAVILANHPSWWDGVAFMLLSRRLLPGRPHFTPMAGHGLARYPFMRRLGVFGIEMGTPRGAITFLRTAGRLLQDPTHMLWINAPGRFADPRQRPIPVAPGVALLPDLAPDAQIVPLALDYPFWDEREPEMLAAFGPAVPAATFLCMDREARAARLGALLAETADRLAEDAISRDPARFVTVVQGKESAGRVAGTWGRLRALLHGQGSAPRRVDVPGERG